MQTSEEKKKTNIFLNYIGLLFVSDNNVLISSILKLLFCLFYFIWFLSLPPTFLGFHSYMCLLVVFCCCSVSRVFSRLFSSVLICFILFIFIFMCSFFSHLYLFNHAFVIFSYVSLFSFAIFHLFL